MTMVPQPLQQLCNIIKAIATNEDQSSHQKPVIDKAEATALALGIAKLMKFKNNNNSGCSIEESGELVAKHLDADFSCFLCRKKCRTRARFFLHFKRHFNKVKKSDNSSSSSSDEEESDSVDGDISSFQIHLRGLVAQSSSHPNKRSKLARGRIQRQPKADHDGDSGCHSAGGASTSNGEATSDCLGDSESSDDSEAEDKKSQALEKSFVARKKHQKSGMTLKERLSLAEKQLDNNETEGLICLTCLKRFSNCQNLRRHLRLHIARDSIKPDFEDFEETDSNRFDDGVEAASLGRYLCDWCPAKFDNRSAARIHESTHRGQEPKCYVCSKQYADRYSLRYHLRTHGIGRQIRCEHCNKAFSKPSRLASHVRSHHKNIRDFACPSCDKAFKTRVHLTNHFRQHSGEKPFNCPVCHEQFRHKASMISHVRKHDGERPFCCEICGKTFREPSTLKAHSRVHTGDKPYSCPDCGKSFTQRAGLNYHRKASHEGARPHACRLCSFSTVKAASLSAHYRNIHQTTGDKSHLPLLTPPISDPSSSTVSEKTTPLPSFDNLKTISASVGAAAAVSASTGEEVETYHRARLVRGQEASTPPLTPPSSSPASTTSTTPCLEDFLPGMQNSETSAASASAQQPGDYLSSLNISELANQLDYTSGAYDYPNYRQHQMYNNQHQLLQHQQHQHVMHHGGHQHQQGNHQWFGYASSQHDMANGGGSANTYSYAGYATNYHFSTASGAGSGGSGPQEQAEQQAQQPTSDYHQMGFPTSSYDHATYGTPSHPSYCI